MHIEPGFVVQAKVVLANVAVVGVLGLYAKELMAKPQLIVKSLVAAVCFSLFMEAFHMQVGPSELHFLGAMPIYLILGFVPALFGFVLGLLFQGLLLHPTDLAMLSVNSLSLILPLLAVHFTLGKNLSIQDLNLKTLAKLDGVYYAGVTTMVGFWLLGEAVTNLSAWATFAVSYAPVVLAEVGFSFGLIKLAQRFGKSQWFGGVSAV